MEKEGKPVVYDPRSNLKPIQAGSTSRSNPTQDLETRFAHFIDKKGGTNKITSLEIQEWISQRDTTESQTGNAQRKDGQIAESNTIWPLPSDE